MEKTVIKLFIIAAMVMAETGASAQNTVIASQMDSVSYSLGVFFGEMIKEGPFESLNYQLVVEGLLASASCEGNVLEWQNARKLRISPYEMPDLITDYADGVTQHRSVQNGEAGRRYADNYLRQNPGAVRMPDGLICNILAPGNQRRITSEYDTVVCDYDVYDIYGTLVASDKAYEGAIWTFIRGLIEGLSYIGEGGIVELVIPADLAYGDYVVASIEPGSTIRLVVQLIRIIKQEV